MTSKIARTALAATFAAGMLLAQTQAPAPGKQHQHGRGGNHAERMATLLNLTPDQRQQATAIMNEAKQAAEPIRAQLKQSRDALTAAVKANDTAGIDRLAASQGVLMGQLAAIHAKAFAKVYTLLTPEQRQKAGQMHQRMKGMFERRMGHMGPKG